MERKEFALCEKCAGHTEQPDFLYVSSAEAPMCASCKQYGETPHHREFPVERLQLPQTARDNNITAYIVDHDVTDTDMSNEEYYDALDEQFESTEDREEVSFRQWQEQRKTGADNGK